MSASLNNPKDTTPRRHHSFDSIQQDVVFSKQPAPACPIARVVPSIPVAEGLKKTYFWIKAQVEKDKAAGIDITKLGTSEIVVQTTDDLDELAAQGLAGKC